MIGSLIVLASFTQIGHVTDIAGILTQAVLLLHLIGIALWIGILFPLLQLSTHSEHIAVTGEMAHRFGVIAAIVVPLLLIAGGWLAFALIGTLPNLFSTSYGQVLLAKIALVVALLGLAAANKLWFVPYLRTGGAAALKNLKRSVQLEIILVTLVLMLTAILTSILILPEVSS